MRKWLITGDCHGDFSRFKKLPNDEEFNIVILGDAGVNFYLDKRDEALKYFLSKEYPNLRFFLIRGNHEQRPELVDGMCVTYNAEVDGPCYHESNYPNIWYFFDGWTYKICGHSVLIIGGAYSIDKKYRLARESQGGYGGWFPQEQLSQQERNKILNRYKGKTVNWIFAHTCPRRYQPIDLFLSFIDQSQVDNSMEIWLEELIDIVDYDKFYFGHYHNDRIIDNKAEMLFQEIKDLVK